MGRGAKAKPRKASKARVAPAGKRAAARLVLGTDCTLREAPALQAQLIATVSRTDTVTVDGGAVERIDAAALQLLVAFARRETAAGRRLAWTAASGELLGAGARLGVLEALNLSVHPGAAA
jgi:ABC-type transporter Mla MlaB component